MENQGATDIELGLIIGTIMMMVLSGMIVFFIYLYQRKLIKRKIEFEKIETLLKKQELKTAYSLIEGREQERKVIAEDLHDNLGSILATLRMYSDLMVERAQDPDLKNLAGKISALTEQTAEETRRISHQLDTGALKYTGLQGPVEQLCQAVRESNRLQVESSIAVDASLQREVATNLYRIVQELFTNTLKHARASRVRLEITQVNQEYVSLIFEDNGVGFSAEAQHKGIGLSNLKARAERLNATLTIDSRPGHGTTVILEVPLA